jgi:hypothetical protein
MASNAVVGLGVEVLTDELGNFLLDMNKKRKKRYFWARPWILRKNKLGASETLRHWVHTFQARFDLFANRV